MPILSKLLISDSDIKQYKQSLGLKAEDTFNCVTMTVIHFHFKTIFRPHHLGGTQTLRDQVFIIGGETDNDVLVTRPLV